MAPRSIRRQPSRSPVVSSKLGVGLAAFSYVALDYWRERATWLPHSISNILQPILWGFLAVLCILRAPKYPYWHQEIKAAPTFVACILVMLLCFGGEITMVQWVTVVLGLDWHRDHAPLPDTGQWVLLALNERLPKWVVYFLRMRLIELHHFIMLFVMLAFSVLFGGVKPPGMLLGARWCLTLGISRVLRFLTFGSTILPAVRPWCYLRFQETTVAHPHPWAQKYYVPYATNEDMVHQLITTDTAAATPFPFPEEYIPNWGMLQFLVPFLRPKAPDPAAGVKNSFVIRPGGGCNDLAYSGHVVLAVLTACAWQEAHPGWASATVWVMVLHSAQREIREHQHYSVDVIAALYVGILLWRTTAWLYTRARPESSREQRVAATLAPRMTELVKAAKDWDMERVRKAVLAAAAAGEIEETEDEHEGKSGAMHRVPLKTVAAGVFIICVISCICLLAFHLTVGG